VGDGGTVIGNRATGNAEAGIILVGDDHLLSGNTGKGNGTFDLELQGNGNIVDATNVFKTTGP
jgi:parallel beta-helix repeat protein